MQLYIFKKLQRYIDTLIELSQLLYFRIYDAHMIIYSTDNTGNANICLYIPIVIDSNNKHNNTTKIHISSKTFQDTVVRVSNHTNNNNLIAIEIKQNMFIKFGHVKIEASILYDHVIYDADHVVFENYKNTLYKGIRLVGADLAQQLLSCCLGSGTTSVNINDNTMDIHTVFDTGVIHNTKQLKDKQYNNIKSCHISKLSKPLVSSMILSLQMVMLHINSKGLHVALNSRNSTKFINNDVFLFANFKNVKPNHYLCNRTSDVI